MSGKYLLFLGSQQTRGDELVRKSNGEDSVLLPQVVKGTWSSQRTNNCSSIDPANCILTTPQKRWRKKFCTGRTVRIIWDIGDPELARSKTVPRPLEGMRVSDLKNNAGNDGDVASAGCCTPKKCCCIFRCPFFSPYTETG